MKDIWADISQNKNFLMFITSIIYILGLFAYFHNYQIIFCIFISFALIFCVIKNIFSIKLAILWLFIFYFGFFNASLRVVNSDTLFDIAPRNSEIIGQVVSIPNQTKKNTLRFFFEVSQIKSGNYTINIPSNKTFVSIKYNENIDNKPIIGNYYSISGKLVKPFESTNPSQFSYRKYLRNFNTYTCFYAKSNDYFLISKELSLKWKLIQKLNNSRNSVLEAHSKYLKSPNLEILGGIVFGDDAVAPPEDIKQNFINSGLLHILAASGMNVAFIYGFLYFFLRHLRVPYKLSVILGIIVIVLYSLMTGLGPSVIRASIMLIFILIGKLVNRDAHSISLLSFVALLMLIYNPTYINDVGFQLSFIVTFGLLLCTNVILEQFKYLPTWLSGSIFVPLIAQAWVIPIQMFYFNTISLYSIFANILIIPFIAIISFCGFVSSILAIIKPISGIVCQIFDFILNPIITILIKVSNYFSELPNSLLITPHPSIYQVLLYYGILILSIYILNKTNENKNIIKILCSLILILFISIIHIPNKNLEIITFDVQNGDAFLIKTPKNEYIIIDTGKAGYQGSSSKAKMIILKYLRDRGIKNISALILTHFDSDHAGGAVDLLQNLNIEKVYVNTLNDYSDIANNIYKHSKQLIEVKSKQELIKQRDFSITLNSLNTKNISNNDASIISIIKYKNFSMLLTGDAGVNTISKLKNQIPENITVLKIGHHGADGVINKELIDYLNPKYSIISVGTNQYGHPHYSTLELLSNTKILRTDYNHSIKFVVNKNEYNLFTYDSNSMKYTKYK